MLLTEPAGERFMRLLGDRPDRPRACASPRPACAPQPRRKTGAPPPPSPRLRRAPSRSGISAISQSGLRSGKSRTCSAERAGCGCRTGDVQVDQGLAVVALLLRHFLEDPCGMGIFSAQSVGIGEIDASVVLFRGYGEGKDFLFAQGQERTFVTEKGRESIARPSLE